MVNSLINHAVQEQTHIRQTRQALPKDALSFLRPQGHLRLPRHAPHRRRSISPLRPPRENPLRTSLPQPCRLPRPPVRTRSHGARYPRQLHFCPRPGHPHLHASPPPIPEGGVRPGGHINFLREPTIVCEIEWAV